MASATAEKELAAAREPIPVRRSQDAVADGIASAVVRSNANSVPHASGGGKEGWDFPHINIAGLQTVLKLRSKFVIKPKLSAHLGLDLNPQTQSVKPVAALEYELKTKDVDWARLRVTNTRAVLVRSFDCSLHRAKLPVTFTLNTAAGFNYKGVPDFDVNVGDLKPNWLVVAAAVTLLALRQPLTGTKAFGECTIDRPTNGTILGEAKLKAQIKEDRLEVGLGQLNAIFRTPTFKL